MLGRIMATVKEGILFLGSVAVVTVWRLFTKREDTARSSEVSKSRYSGLDFSNRSTI